MKKLLLVIFFMSLSVKAEDNFIIVSTASPFLRATSYAFYGDNASPILVVNNKGDIILRGKIIGHDEGLKKCFK